MQEIPSNIKRIKLDNLPELKLIQLQYEINTWKRLLSFMSEENIQLKNRLSEVLKNNFDKNLLEEVEIYYTNIIKEDELFILLRNEINELDNLLVRKVFEEEEFMKNFEKKFRRFSNNIKNSEKQFGKLKLNFNNYLTVNIQNR